MQFGNYYRVKSRSEQERRVWGDERVVHEDDLTDEERRFFRARELWSELRVDELERAVRESVGDEKEVIRNELNRRRERMEKIGEDAWMVALDAGELIGKIERGKEGYAVLTAGVFVELERLYQDSLPYAKLTPVQEAQLRQRLYREAKDDHTRGEFATMAEALRHYGLEPDDEEEQ